MKKFIIIGLVLIYGQSFAGIFDHHKSKNVEPKSPIIDMRTFINKLQSFWMSKNNTIDNGNHYNAPVINMDTLPLPINLPLFKNDTSNSFMDSNYLFNDVEKCIKCIN